MKVSCSDLPGATFSFNQDKYQDSAYDGLLVECTYVADGTEAEFTVEGCECKHVHLYAFSNRVASSSTGVDVSGAGAVGTFSKSLTGLSAGSRYEYAFVATNNGGATQSNTNSFVTLGLPQVLTPGATDVTKTSVTLNADLNSTGGVSYTTGGPFSSSTVPGLLMWLDGNDPDADGTANTTQYDLVNNTGWKDKSGNNRDANRVTSAPTFMPNTLGGKGVVDFDGAWSGDAVYMDDSNDNLAAHTENFSIFMLYRQTGNGAGDVHVQVVTSQHTNNWRFGALANHTRNVASFNGNLWPTSADTGSNDTNWHLIQATLNDIDKGDVWLDNQKVLTAGTGADDGTNRKPTLLNFAMKGNTHSYRAKVQIADFFIINRVVPESERLKIEGHLARKWGLMGTMFSAAHPYYSSDPYQPTITQGGEDAAVTFYWGDNNGSTTPGNWDNTHALSGTHGIGVLSHPLTGLTTGTTYYYTAKATTSAGTSWGPVQTFVPANTAINKYSIPDLALWIDATDLNGDGTTDTVTNGAAVSAWTDKSLTTATVNQTNTDNQPTRQTNSFGTKPSVRFDGTGDFLNVSTLRSEVGGYSAYAATRRPDQAGDNNGRIASESTWHLTPSGSNAEYPSIVVKSTGSSGSLTNIKLGKNAASSTEDFGGDVGELLIFTRQLTTSEEQKVEGYLAHRWGATNSLEANHPYKNVAPIFDNKPLIRDLSEISNSSINNISGMEVWFDASDLDANGVTDSTASGNISSWSDKSGKAHHALTANGTPELKTTSGPSNGRVVEIRGGDYLPVSGSFFVKDMFFVFRSPPTNSVWSGYGGPFGRNPSSGNNLRSSNYITQHNQTYFHSNQLPTEVFKNGTALSGSFNLGTITNYMVVRLIVNDNDTSNNSYHQIGRVTGLQCNLDIAEIVAFNSKVSNADAALVEGYMAVKWGLTSALPSGHNYKSYTSWPDMLITTGQAVNLQIPADRNPTSWSASGLASGLSINNSGLISGSVSSLSAFTSTVTASNADGNDSKSISFGVSKGYRVIDWNQTFAGLVYGDSPLSLTAIATGTGDLNYTSSDSQIIEINGTSAIIRGGGSVTLTATAAENATAFAAVPVSHTFSVAKAPLTITGQDLSLSVGDAIPDLNYTVTGWKHSDASLAIAANPAGLGLKLWLDASDSSTITHTSNAVSQWSDKSGNSNHATQSTSGSKPLFDTNQILFDGSDDSLSLAHGVVPDSNEASMVFLVTNCDATSGNDGFITNGRFTSGQSFSYRTNGTSQVSWYSWGNDLSSVSSTDNSPVKVHALELSVTGNTFKIYHDGTLKGTKTSFTGTANAGSETGFLGRTSTSEYLQGSIKEVIIVMQEPTDTVRKSIEGYLAHKWGLSGSLPSNHSHKSISLTRGPSVTTDATSSSSAGTYYVRPSGAQSKKYSFTYVDGDLVLSSLTAQEIAWGQSFSGVGVGQTVDLNASASSNLAVLYSVDDTSVAELAVTNQSSLQAWYKFNETSGTDAVNSSASGGRKGSVENSTSGHYNTGKFGNAITLDGSNDHVRVYGYTGINGTAGRTVALWFKTSTANKPLLQYGASGTGSLFKLSLNSSGAAVLDLGSATITSSTTGLADGNWHHIAASFPSAANSGAAKLYVDGTGNNGSGTATINTGSAADLIIGLDGTSGSGYFNGQIDDVRFYDGEMNSTLVGQLYGNGNGDFNRLKIKAAGTVTLTATQPGDGTSYAPAPSTTLTATFNKSDQTISFGTITDRSVGDFNFIPTAVASSGLDVSFTSSDSLVAEVQSDGRTIKVRAAGTATITANQAGDSAYNAAPAVTQTLTVGYFNLQANSLPGIRLWLDANNIDGDDTADTITDGTAIIQWIDQSGNNNHAGQATSSNRPTYGAAELNNKGVINFTAAQSFDLSADANIRVIAAVIMQASNQSAVTKPFGGNQNLTTSAQKFALGAIDSGVSSSDGGIVVWQFEPGAYSIYVDGVNKGSSTSSLSPNAFNKVGNDFAGEIAEVVAYDRALSDGVRQKIEGYLAHKWGLVSDLSSSHSYKNTKPAFGGTQILTFQPISDKQAGQSATLDVSADSGLTTFSFDSNDSTVVSFSGDATNGYQVNALKVGKVTITATQAGQAPWQSATASQPFIVTATPRADQTITFADIPDKNVLSSNFSLDANASSGLPVSFTSLHPGVATVESNGTVTIVGAGVATMRATQDGNGSYNPAPSVEKTLTVTKVPQTITFNALSDASLHLGTYSLSGKATASSGLAVSYATSDASVASLSGTTLTLHQGGSVTITASQGGNDTYLAAADATQSLTIKDDRYLDQNITWTQTISGLTIGASNVSMTANSIDADSGADTNLTISYASSNTAVATVVSGNSLQIVGAGSATITASQAGNVSTGGRYNAATSVTKSISVGKASQTIVTNAGATSLPNLSKDNGDFPFVPAIKSVDANGADTNLTLAYSSSNTSVIAINGLNLQPLSVGTSTITVSQPGNTDYNAAASKTFTITVTQRTPYTDSFSGLQLWLNGKDVNGDGLADSSSDFLGGNKTSSWADRSGNSNTLTQGTSANQPIWVPAGGLTFDGNDFLSKATLPSDLAGNSGLTLLVVAESNVTASRSLLNLGALSGNVDRLALTTSGSFLYQNGSSAIAQNGSYNLDTAKSVAVFKRPAGGNFDQGTYFLNGTSKGITLSGAADASGFSIPSSAPLTLGKASGGIAGKIYEVMLYDNKLAEYSRKRLEGYLAHKWGGASNLPSGHPFKNTAPTFGGSQSIVTNAHTIPVVSSSPTLSFDIGLFTLEDYGIYATSGLPLSYATSNANVVAITNGKLDPKGAGTVTLTLSQAGDSHFSAASNATFSLTITQNRSQNITFAPIADVNTTVSTISLSASASSGLAVSFASSDTDVATVSGSTVTIVGPGTVTITASQAGGTDPSNSNITYSAAASVSQDFTVISIGDPLSLIFDSIGTMGTGQTFKVRAVLMNATTGKPVYMPKYLATGGSVTYSKTAQTGGGGSISGTSVTTGSSSGSITIKAYATGGGFETKFSSITVQVDGSKTGQKILVREGGDSGGLRDLPISRRPIGIGQMFSSTSNLALSYSVAGDAPVKLDGTGKDAKLVFKTSKDGFSKNDLKGKFTGDTMSFDITVTQTGNGSFHAAESVTRTIKLKKPTKSLFFEERKADARYDDMKTKAMNRMPAGVSGEKATALFDSDKYDSDGDGVSNLLERAFGGDSLGNDSRGARPAPVKTNDGKEYLSFTRYDSDYQSTMGVQYIVEKSTDRRTWSSSGIEQVGSAVDLGGGMERVVYRTTSATSAGNTQFIRVRVKAR